MGTSMHTQKPCSGGTIELNHIVYSALQVGWHTEGLTVLCKLVVHVQS